MTHRAEQVMVAVLANITGLKTTKGRVFRDLEYDLKEVPALTLEYGGEDKLRDLSQNLADWTLYFSVDIHVKQEGFSTIVNKIRSEITTALNVDKKQGLSFVHNTIEVDLSSPEKGFVSEKPTVMQSMNWQVVYRRNITSAE